MNYSEILPAHWEVVEEEEPAKRKFSFFSDDGRDYNKPMFIRKDGLARIYFNEDETESSGYLYGIVYDMHDDGDCCGDLQEALNRADDYVAKSSLCEEFKEICK
jgi:hypothetical protein